jgi:hypothetical protein
MYEMWAPMPNTKEVGFQFYYPLVCSYSKNAILEVKETRIYKFKNEGELTKAQ